MAADSSRISDNVLAEPPNSLPFASQFHWTATFSTSAPLSFFGQLLKPKALKGGLMLPKFQSTATDGDAGSLQRTQREQGLTAPTPSGLFSTTYSLNLDTLHSKTIHLQWGCTLKISCGKLIFMHRKASFHLSIFLFYFFTAGMDFSKAITPLDHLIFQQTSKSGYLHFGNLTFCLHEGPMSKYVLVGRHLAFILTFMARK